MKKIIYSRSDGALSIIHPVRNTYPHPEDLTDDEVLARAMKDVPPDALNVHVLDETEIPTDRTFRNAWIYQNNKIEPDLDQSKEIKKAQLRLERKPLLEALDAAFMKALEDQDSEAIAQIKTKKQRLRDITKEPALLNAQTPEEIKQVTIPVDLKLPEEGK